MTRSLEAVPSTRMSALHGSTGDLGGHEQMFASGLPGQLSWCTVTNELFALAG